ncbi:MAG: PLP-dependent aminotransferase family protein, partial [Stackebrandtia sp.]
MSIGGRGDRTARIYRQLRDAIVDGRLRDGDRLPATRDLARQLEVSRNTVAAAYQRLTSEGFARTRTGAGTFVCATALPAVPRRVTAQSLRPRQLWTALPPAAMDRPRPRYDLRAGICDVSLFPFEAWRRLTSRALRPRNLHFGHYTEPAGNPGLRDAITRHIGVSRGVRAEPADVLVTQGAQQALDLIARVLIEPGDPVAVEDPGYPPARAAFTAAGARVVPVPVDDEGIVVDALPERVRLVYTTPSHQFPLGVVLSLRRRVQLLEWARQHRAAVIEDDYDSEFRYSQRPLEPLHGLDSAGHVVYVGSFSKTLLPALRLGFLIAPEGLRTALSAAKQVTDWHGETFTQAVLAEFIDEGLLGTHIRKASRVYGARHGELARRVEGMRGLRLVESSAGLHVCARAASGDTDVDAVVRLAGARGVALRTLAGTHSGAEPPGLLIGFGAIAYEHIGSAMDIV